MESMCNGVFKPVCSPEVCDVPKIPYSQDLVKGKGFIEDRNCCKDTRELIFKLHIYRELMDVFGELEIMEPNGNCVIYSDRLEAYHAPTEENIIAVFHYVDKNSKKSRELAVFAKTDTESSPAKFYIYSAPLNQQEIYLGGIVKNGFIKIEISDVQHGAH